ncbi:hypothetical protein B0H17DRAFT_1202090 [Mycena rosella]|uniref:Uncharacterized protein n=1 Tax=Mycena rosella TaxID=1033263 RepID=A0AAD7DEL0_MYCRO|nr:hypothetical protein B0H17DRAFT_1202090 [Mycena rosella]
MAEGHFPHQHFVYTLLQPDVINNVFASDYMYWTCCLSPTMLQKMLESSLCFGVYIASDDPVSMTVKS